MLTPLMQKTKTSQQSCM